MTDNTTTRRDFIKTSIVTGIVAGSAIPISCTTSSVIAFAADYRDQKQQVDLPLNQANIFDHSDILETAWIGNFINTGELKL